MNHFVFRVFGIVLVLVIYSAFIVQGADKAHGENCGTAGDECNEDNNECNASSVCACTSSSFRNTADDACLLKVALDATCASGEPTGQCTDTNAECGSGLTCDCKTNFFKNKNSVCTAVVPALDGSCDASDSASDQCTVADSECRTDGTDKCLCKATHYRNSGACEIRKKPEENCAVNQCVDHATCDTTCKCDAGYTAKPTTTPTMCSGVVKFATLPYMYVVPILVSMMFLLR